MYRVLSVPVVLREVNAYVANEEMCIMHNKNVYSLHKVLKYTQYPAYNEYS